MNTVNNLKAIKSQKGIRLWSTDSVIMSDILIEKSESATAYIVELHVEEFGSITARLDIGYGKLSELLMTVQRSEVVEDVDVESDNVYYNMRVGCYRVLYEDGINTFTLQGTDAYGSLEWNDGGCEIIADLSDDRIDDDSASDKTKIILITLMILQSIIGDHCPAMKCKVFKEYYDSLTSK